MSAARPVWRRLLDGWLAIAGHFGEVQTQVLLSLVYVCVIGPTALVVAASGRDFLTKRRLREPGSAWREVDSAGADLERSRHPF